MTPNLTADQQADPLYIMTHSAANANRDCVQQFLSTEGTCGSIIYSAVNPGIQNAAAREAAADWAAFPYRSTGSKFLDWEAFYMSLGMGGDQPFLADVFTLLLLGVS